MPYVLHSVQYFLCGYSTAVDAVFSDVAVADFGRRHHMTLSFGLPRVRDERLTRDEGWEVEKPL
jgi:hypothetical protein